MFIDPAEAEEQMRNKTSAGGEEGGRRGEEGEGSLSAVDTTLT